MKSFYLPLSLALLFLFAGSACSSYRLGPPGELPFKTVYVEPVTNQSYAPQVQALLTDDIIESLLQGGRVKVTSKEEADAILSVQVVNYFRNVGATLPQDTGRAQSFDLTLSANIHLQDTRTGNSYIKERPVTVTQQAFVQGGFQTAEYQAMPVLTRKMARAINDIVTSVW